MNIEKKIKEELLEAAENIKGARAFVLVIGYEDDHSLSNIVGGGRNVLSMLIKAMEHALSCFPDVLETELRMKVAELILRGEDDASE
jgi:hypothetical protein